MSKSKIVTLPFPYDDMSATKLRPALCLTKPIGALKHIVIAYMTSSAPKPPLASDLTIHWNHPNFSETGLSATTTIRLHRLVTVRSSYVRRQLGVLPSDLENEVAIRLKNLFDLS